MFLFSGEKDASSVLYRDIYILRTADMRSAHEVCPAYAPVVNHKYKQFAVQVVISEFSVTNTGFNPPKLTFETNHLNICIYCNELINVTDLLLNTCRILC